MDGFGLTWSGEHMHIELNIHELVSLSSAVTVFNRIRYHVSHIVPENKIQLKLRKCRTYGNVWYVCHANLIRRNFIDWNTSWVVKANAVRFISSNLITSFVRFVNSNNVVSLTYLIGMLLNYLISTTQLLVLICIVSLSFWEKCRFC